MKNYNKEIITNILILIFCIAVAFAISLCSSCTSTKYIPIQTIKTDTLYKSKKDSINLITKFNLKDSINIRDSIVIRINSNGGIIGKDSWHYKDHFRSSTDSTNYYKSALDSILNKKQVIKEKIIPVVKTEVKPYPLKNKIGLSFIFLIIGGSIGVFHKYIFKILKKIL